MKMNNNLVKCGFWMAAAIIFLLMLVLSLGGSAAYVFAGTLCLVCMAMSIFYWVRFAMPLVKNAFTVR